jgi:type I restriction enzyme S subunit
MMRATKDSGIAWIGDIPGCWEIDKLKYHLKRNEPKNPGEVVVLSLYRELGVIPKDSRDDNHNVTSEDTSKYKYVRPGNFVINKMKAWQGSVAVSEYEGIVSPAYFVYEFTDASFFKRYFHYLLRSCYKDEFMRLSGGIRVGQWDLPAEALENTPVLIPPMDKQQRIADFLDAKCAEIDALTADIQAQIDTLEQYKRSIITETVTKGLNQNAEMKDSGIEWVGQMPMSWSTVPNKYLMYKIKSICPIYNGENILSLTTNGVIIRDLNGGGKMPTSFDGYQKIVPGNLLMCLFDIDVTPRCIGLIKDFGLTSPAYSQFAMKNGAYAPYYYYYYLMVDYTKELLHMAKNLRHSLTEDQLGAIKAPRPPYDEQIQIAEYLDNKCSEINQVIADKNNQLTTLDKYKKSLIFEYITGKKEVPCID